MIDFRDITTVDKTFQLENTISENLALRKANKELLLIIGVSFLLIGLSYYIVQNENAKAEKNT